MLKEALRRTFLPVMVYGLLGTFIGAIAWGSIGFFAFAPFLAMAYGYAPNKRARGILVYGYFLSGSWVLLGVFNAFWPSAAPYLGIVAWPAVALLLALPWWIIGAFGKERPVSIGMRMALTLILTSIPPLSAWSLISPLMMAGFYYPGTGIAGLLLSVILLSLLSALFAHFKRQDDTLRAPSNTHQPSPGKFSYMEAAVITLVIVSILLHITYLPPATPRNIHGVSLPWKALPLHVSFWHNLERQNRLRLWIQHHLTHWPTHQILLLPENIAGFYFPNGFSAGIIVGIQQDAAAHQDTVLFGADDVYSPPMNQGKDGKKGKNAPRWTYTDALNAYGLHQGAFPSRQPVPLGEWKPWENGSARAFWWIVGPDYLGKTPFAMAICYSQLLVWPLASYFIQASHRPQWILAPENHDWEKTPAENHIQALALHAWARLYGLPVISANDFPLHP